ncbi:hypothetical protein MSAN_02413900 [Mycena sanguinolenta]|uniref:Transmembrane protein n=1 Tax=Mycena sanguinolenta TaxID=230812 RepID=A0A8H6X384_9AGAR|nr:hypothetical protein MSAN_02413900 [Mycena sanguinolenta]
MSSNWASSPSGAVMKDKEKSLREKEKDILRRYKMASHFETPSRKGLFGWLRWVAFTYVCFVAYGRPDMKHLWAALRLEEEGDDSGWKEFVCGMTDRLNNVQVVGGLLLATSALFLTTVPPRPATIDYTRYGSYICIVSAFGLLIGSIICAVAGVLMLSQASACWHENVWYRNRTCVYGTTIALAGPTFSAAPATILLAFGMHSKLNILNCFLTHGP